MRLRMPVTLPVLLIAAAAPAPAGAHHGWAWSTGQNIEITGTVVAARLGNPHGLVTLDVDGVRWTAEVGQPWRNERAGLTDAAFATGNTLTIDGEPSARPNEKLIKAERVRIGDQVHDLYPER